jgi:hypothetical protein
MEAKRENYQIYSSDGPFIFDLKFYMRCLLGFIAPLSAAPAFISIEK